MFKKWYGVMVVGLALLLVLTAAACGDDDDKDNGGGSSDTDLSQTFDSATGLSVKYPEGWAASEDSEMIQLVTSEEAMEAETIGEDELGILIFNPMVVSMIAGGAESPTDILANFSEMMGDEGEFGDVSETKIGDHDGARVNVSDDETQGFMVAFKVNESDVVIATVVTAKDQLDKHESTALDILGTVSYTAPEG